MGYIGRAMQRLLTLCLLALVAASAAPMAAAQSSALTFKGFERARYAEHDALIERLVGEFNRNKAAWTGATEEQADGIDRLHPAVIKALLIQESGGGKKGDLAAWAKDPGMINLPGNWDESKADLGLKKPVKPNSGTLEGNLKATIRFLARKGFGRSGQAPKGRKQAFFDGWKVALQRYNGRTVRTANGKTFQVNYSETILKRATDRDEHVPIPLPKPVDTLARS